MILFALLFYSLYSVYLELDGVYKLVTHCTEYQQYSHVDDEYVHSKNRFGNCTALLIKTETVVEKTVIQKIPCTENNILRLRVNQLFI